MTHLIRSRGDYKNLITYQKSDVIFQITFYFCHKYLSKGDRTIDQMIQAARSCKQNIVEGSAAASTSSKTEIKLTNVAKASLRELLEDYEDFLNTRGHRIWEKGSKEYEAMRNLGRTHTDSKFFMDLIETRPPETIANMAIILIKQTDYLLFRQLESLQKNFIKEGGFSERIYTLRNNQRNSSPYSKTRD